MASSKTTPIFFADGAADTLLLSIQIEFSVGLGRREDEITNNSDLSPFNFRLLCNIRSPSPGASISHKKHLGTTFAHIFLFLDVQIPANALCRPIRTNSHAPVIAFVSQNILKIKWYRQRLTQGYSLDGGSGWWASVSTYYGINDFSCVSYWAIIQLMLINSYYYQYTRPNRKSASSKHTLSGPQRTDSGLLMHYQPYSWLVLASSSDGF